MTAIEFLGQEEHYAATSGDEDEITHVMIQFARFHVKKALEKASQIELSTDIDYESGEERFYQNEEGILNSYPPENIK